MRENSFGSPFLKLMRDGEEMKKRILPICLIVIGLIFLISPAIKNYMVSSLSKKSYENLTIEPEQESIVEQSKSIADIDFANDHDVLKAMFSDTKNNVGIGLLAIPSVNLKLPIFREATNTNLLKGAGMMNEVFQGFDVGNVILAGHHMKKEGLLFQPLTKLAGGSVYIMDHEKVYEYRMEKPYIVNEEDTSVLSESFDGLTLITCDVPTPTKKRLIYQGKLVNEVEKQEMEEIFKTKIDN